MSLVTLLSCLLASLHLSPTSKVFHRCYGPARLLLVFSSSLFSFFCFHASFSLFSSIHFSFSFVIDQSRVLIHKSVILAVIYHPSDFSLLLVFPSFDYSKEDISLSLFGTTLHLTIYHGLCLIRL
jgi:hypothetical protein